MTNRLDIDRQVAAWLEAERPPVAPEGLLEAVQAGVSRTGRRAGWLIADRWTWRHAAAIRTTVRAALALAVVASLVAILVVVAGLIGSRRPAPPFGLTTAGRVAVDTAEGIVLTNADGSNRSLLVPANGRSVSPTWSRDGLLLAYWHRPAGGGSWSLIVVGADGSGQAVLTEGVTLRDREAELRQPSNLAWSPNSSQLAFAADDSDGTSIYVATLGRVGAERLTDPELLAVDPAWSPAGDVIAFRSSLTGEIHVVAPDGSGERRLSPLTGAVYWLDWSPDGSRLAAAATNRAGYPDIFVIVMGSEAAMNVSNDPGYEISPSWSPDGSRLAWVRAPEFNSPSGHLIVSVGDGSNAIELDTPADFAQPVWAPDGTRLYTYGKGPSGFSSLLVLDPSGVAPVVRLPAEGNIGSGNWQRLP